MYKNIHKKHNMKNNEHIRCFVLLPIISITFKIGPGLSKALHD
jgi:hypothetical protein